MLDGTSTFRSIGQSLKALTPTVTGEEFSVRRKGPGEKTTFVKFSHPSNALLSLRDVIRRERQHKTRVTGCRSERSLMGCHPSKEGAVAIHQCPKADF